MNKHMIFLPALLTSAVSLHVLSFYIEEPVEIVQDSKIQVSSKIETPTKTIDNKLPSDKQSEKIVIIPVEKGNKNVVVNKDGTKEENKQNTVVPSATANPVSVPVQNTVPSSANPVLVQTAEPSTAPITNIKVASALIPSKNFTDIVKEAKLIGGRVDPFLSMKPPELEKLPEVPTFVSKPADTFPDNSFDKNAGKKSPGLKSKVPNPPTAWVPNFSDNKLGKIAKGKGKNTVIASANTKNKSTKEKDNIIVWVPETKVEDGLVLTGIITGSKPLALLTVDKENKIFGIGDVIRPNSNTKIVSIDFDTHAITIKDEKNRRAKLEIKD